MIFNLSAGCFGVCATAALLEAFTPILPLATFAFATLVVVICTTGSSSAEKKREYPNEIKWRSSGFYNFKCPFILSTKEKDGEVVVVKMADPMVHVCSQEKVGVIMHKFKLRLRERMTSNLDEGFAKIWSEERSKLLESLKDQPELTICFLMSRQISEIFPNFSLSAILNSPASGINRQQLVITALTIGVLK